MVTLFSSITISWDEVLNRKVGSQELFVASVSGLNPA